MSQVAATLSNVKKESVMRYLEQPLEPDPVIESYKQDVDRTLIRENLKLTPTERLQKLMAMQKWALELRKAGRRERAIPE